MAVYVNTNYSALQGQRYLGNVQNQLTTTYQRLSSGMRINSAKDDAAGLQIADRLTSQINGLNQGNRNAADGIALAQTIEAGMDEVAGMLQKVRTLAVQANNGTNTAEDRKALGTEMASLLTELIVLPSKPLTPVKLFSTEQIRVQTTTRFMLMMLMVPTIRVH